jgi:hypothetical protein
MKIREIIEYLKNDNESEVLNCNPPYAPTMKSLYSLIDSYWNSRYANGDYDKFGWKKPFFNIVIGPTLVAAKTTDIDTKNIQIHAEDGQDYWTAFLLEKELKHWMKEHHFGELLNQITYARPKDGHIILKKVGDQIYFVPIRNVYFEVDSEKLEKPLVELHIYSDEKDLKKQNWEKIDETIENYKNSEISDVEVYEIWGEVDDDDFNYHIISGLDIDKPVIHVAKNIEYPYKDLAWEKINGRATGRGVVELLFEAQIANNENEYHFRHGLQWSSKRLFQTRDQNAAKNLISEKENGDVISVNSEITPIIIDERNLSSYQYSDGKWGVNAERLTFSQDVMRGDRPPSGTPLGTSALQAQMAGGFFELKREDLGMFIKEIVTDWIIPTFIKENSAEHTIHILNLLGDDNLCGKKEN